MITEDRILLDVTRTYLQETSESQITFAQEKLFPALAEAGIRLAKTATTAADFHKELANAKNQISRVFNEKQELPLKWKWIWVSCLPSPYRERCIFELDNLTHSTVPSVNGQHASADIGHLAKELGEAIAATAIIAADGKYDHNDSPAAVMDALNQLYDARDAALAQIAAIERATGHQVKRSVTITTIKQVTIS